MNYQELLQKVRAKQQMLRLAGSPTMKLPPYVTDEQINPQWHEAFDEFDAAEAEYMRSIYSQPF